MREGLKAFVSKCDGANGGKRRLLFLQNEVWPEVKPRFLNFFF